MIEVMRKIGWEIIATIFIAIMVTTSLILLISFQNLPMAVLVIFIGSYILISTEKINRTAMSLLGVALVGFVLYVGQVVQNPLGVSFAELIEHVEWDTIIFIIAMSIIVSVAAASGIFQYIALRIAARSEGDPKQLFIVFLVFISGISLFFDTVSTMLIAAPLTIEICKALEIDFKPFLVAEAIVCNFSSIPSVVGAVPNLVIAGETELDVGFLFITFMPLSIILFLVSLPIFLRWYSSSFGVTDEHRVDAVFSIDPATMIKDRWDFNISAAAIVFLVIGFALGPSLRVGGMEKGLTPPMVALIIAGFLLLLAHERANEFLNRIGWPTVFFLVGLFGLVGALDITGWINFLADVFNAIIGDNPILQTVFLVWIPAMLSAFLDNLPVSLVLAPIAEIFGNPLALVFAVNVGGYIFTPLGSPANMVAIGLSEQQHDPIPFIEFIKIGTLLGMIHLAIGSGYLILLQFLFGI
nr:MAG: hypothetical protein AM325_05835 [Candidatus Thorarchaeota archaeon SMTZ1-45]